MSSEQGPRPRGDALVERAQVTDSTVQRLREDRLSLVRPAGRAASALESAKLRLLTTNDGAPAELAWCGLAALAVGETRVAERLLHTLDKRNDQSARPDALSLELMLLAAHCAWTGDIAAGYERLPRARHVVSNLPHATADLEEAALRLAALRAMAVAAETIGDAAFSAELRQLARQQSAALQTSARSASNQRRALQVALGAIGHSTTESPRVTYASNNPVELGFACWAEAVAGRVDEAWRAWLQLADHVHATASSDAVAAGTHLILSFVVGLLGAEPDAARNRLRLSPRISSDQQSLEISHLRLGDASVRFSFDRDDRCCRFRVEQLEGATPLRLIFEPVLPAPGIHEARVDARPALLDVRSLGKGCVAPVQLMLDTVRTIELDLVE